MPSSYIVERLVSYASIIKAPHGRLSDMNLITDTYNYCIETEVNIKKKLMSILFCQSNCVYGIFHDALGHVPTLPLL